jgi:hypothetical protein
LTSPLSTIEKCQSYASSAVEWMHKKQRYESVAEEAVLQDREPFKSATTLGNETFTPTHP